MDMHSHPTNVKIRLVPVIEMLPEVYGNPDRSLPVDAVGDAYQHYWSGSMADAGIEGLKPVGLWHVPIEQLTSLQLLERIVHVNRFDDDAELPGGAFDRFLDPEERLIAFNGGYALSIDDRIVCTPRCCADLANIEDWQMAADHRQADRVMVWIGHPWIEVRYEGGCLMFIDPSELEGRPEWIGELSILPNELQQAIDQAKREVQGLYRRLLPVLESKAPPGQADRIARILTATDPD